MKKTVLILTALILTLLFSSCIKIYMPSDTNTETNKETDTDDNFITDDTVKPSVTITHKTEEMDVYPSYDLGNCYVSEIKNSTPTSGNVSYYIFNDYNDIRQNTDSGKNIDESIFENNCILAVKFGYTRDRAGIIGFKNLKTGTACNVITVVNDGSGKDLNTECYYLEIPKEEFNGWEKFGTLELRKETVNYAIVKEEFPPSDFVMKEDGEILILSRQELREFIKENNLSIIVETLQITDNYIVCYSKKQFGTSLLFTKPVVNGDTVTLYRDYTLSNFKNERPFLHIIPIMSESETTINNVELISRVINVDEFYAQGEQIENTATTYKTVDFYKTFHGGLYYGTELASRNESSYTIIESYREMLTKTEFYIDEKVFEDNYILVLKLVGNYQYRLGFANAKIGKEDTDVTTIAIDLYLTPYYDQILNGSNEDLKEEIDIIEPSEIVVNYTYIVIPKSKIPNATKTGDLEINKIETFNDYSEPTIDYYNYSKEGYNISHGNTWIISSKKELTQFNETFGTYFHSVNRLGKEYGNEYVVIYVENYYDYEILQKTENVTDTVYCLSLLTKNKETVSTNKEGGFICFLVNSSDTDKKFVIEYTQINYGSYDTQSVEKEISVYDHYSISLRYNNKPDWNHIVLTTYAQFEEVYNTYKYDPEETLSADMIFSNEIFDTHYVVAFRTYGDADVYYNARISGDKYLYLYAFNDRDMIDESGSKTLTFVTIPKNRISSEISGVKVQFTKQTAYNGPFENVVITSNSQEEVKLGKSFVIINSDEELQTVLANYEDYQKLRDVDYENNIILAFNRRAYTTIEYLYGDFVNFKTSIHGTASITFMSEDREWLTDWTKIYVLDLVIIPKEYIKHEINYFYVSYAEYGDLFETDELDRIILEDTFYD